MTDRGWLVTCYDGSRKIETVLTGGRSTTEAERNAWAKVLALCPEAFPVAVRVAIVEEILEVRDGKAKRRIQDGGR